jgi:hypothetical protein
MNPTWENDNLLTSRTHVLSKGEVTAVASNIVRHRQGILETTRKDYGFEADMDTCRKPNARVQSYPTCLHLLIKESYHRRESAVERLHSRQKSGTPVIPDSPSPQSRNRLQMSGGSSSVSVKESHKDPGVVGDAHERRSSATKWLQQSDSKWNSGSGTLTDRPPLQPFSRHGVSGARDESRWSSGCHL